MDKICPLTDTYWIQICQPSLSFYPHPNISDRFPSHFIFVGAKMNTSIIKSIRKKGRNELFLVILIFDGSNLCTDICKTIFVFLEVQFHHEGGLSGSRYLELFFSTRPIFSPYQKSASTEAPFNLF